MHKTMHANQRNNGQIAAQFPDIQGT